MYSVALGLLVIWVASQASVLAMGLAAVAFKVPIKEIAIGGGPKLFSFNIGSTAISFRAFQMSSGVEFPVDDEGVNVGELQPWWVRGLIPLAGPLIFFLAAYALLGSQFFGETFSGLTQVFQGAIRPLSKGEQLLSGYAELVDEQGFWPAGAGIVLAKFSALQLYPIFTGGVWQSFRSAFLPGRRSSAWMAFIVTNLLILVAIVASWNVAITNFLIVSS